MDKIKSSTDYLKLTPKFVSQFSEKETNDIKKNKGDAWLGDTTGNEYLFKNTINYLISEQLLPPYLNIFIQKHLRFQKMM